MICRVGHIESHDDFYKVSRCVVVTCPSLMSHVLPCVDIDVLTSTARQFDSNEWLDEGREGTKKEWPDVLLIQSTATH